MTTFLLWTNLIFSLITYIFASWESGEVGEMWAMTIIIKWQTWQTRIFLFEAFAWNSFLVFKTFVVALHKASESLFSWFGVSVLPVFSSQDSSWSYCGWFGLLTYVDNDHISHISYLISWDSSWSYLSDIFPLLWLFNQAHQWWQQWWWSWWWQSWWP